jgi:WD40 repeat protein
MFGRITRSQIHRCRVTSFLFFTLSQIIFQLNNYRHYNHSYENGGIKVWEVDSGNLVLTLNGHRSAITALNYNSTGSLLVSGARDTDLIGSS